MTFTLTLLYSNNLEVFLHYQLTSYKVYNKFINFL